MGSKQVLVMRKMDKGCRTGKYCAQAGHAAVGSLFSTGNVVDDNFVIPLSNPFVREWVTGNFRKIACYVETDAELIELYETARNAGIACAIIKDSGLTEFNGIPTLTAVGIGPDADEVIDKITGHLKLF